MRERPILLPPIVTPWLPQEKNGSRFDIGGYVRVAENMLDHGADGLFVPGLVKENEITIITTFELSG